MPERHYIAIHDPNTLTLTEDQVPLPGPGEVLIEVAYAGVNRADVLQRLGFYPPPADASPIMGLEVAGHIAALGEGVKGWQPGDRVCALVHGGGYATAAIARADHCLPVPDTLSLDAAAALPEALLTSWANVIERGGLKPGETLLVQGGASGIGTIAVQLAVQRGARVIATAGSHEKCETVRRLGAEFVANYRDGDFAEQLSEAGYGGHIDVIFDMAGGDYTQKHIELAAVDGRIVCIGVMRGAESTVNLAALFMKRLTLTGSTLRAMPSSEKAAAFARIRAEVMPSVAAGDIAPHIHTTLPLADALVAHDVMVSGAHTGKILLDCRAVNP